MSHPHEKSFLTGEWRTLLMANYKVDPDLLRPLVPRGTELDTFQDAHYISLVGFMFRKIKICGLHAFFHRTFEEVNLRFYVRRESPYGPRRGVVFIKEIVPKRIVTAMANWLYNEHYVTHPMRHTPSDLSHTADASEQRVSYGWKHQGAWCEMSATAARDSQPLAEGSEAEFITEHFWGYTAKTASRTLEYEVEHPRWHTYPVHTFNLTGDMQSVYGPALGSQVTPSPASVFLAEGSPIVVRRARLI